MTQAVVSSEALPDSTALGVLFAPQLRALEQARGDNTAGRPSHVESVGCSWRATALSCHSDVAWCGQADDTLLPSSRLLV